MIWLMTVLHSFQFMFKIAMESKICYCFFRAPSLVPEYAKSRFRCRITEKVTTLASSHIRYGSNYERRGSNMSTFHCPLLSRDGGRCASSQLVAVEKQN